MNRKMHNRLGRLFTNIPYTKLDKINRAIDHPDLYDMAFTNMITNGNPDRNNYDVFNLTKKHKHRRYNHDPLSGLYSAYRVDPQNAIMGSIAHQAVDMMHRVFTSSIGADNTEVLEALINATLPAKRRNKGLMGGFENILSPK